MGKILHLFLAVSLLVGFATSLVLAVELEPGRAEPEIASSRDVVRSYYAAVEGYLKTGDLHPVRRMLAPEFRDAVDPTTGTAGFERYLGALRTTYPDLRITVSNLLASGSKVIAEITLHPGQTVASNDFISNPGPIEAVLALETFEVDGQHITTYRSSLTREALWFGFDRDIPQLSRSPGQQVALARVVLDPGQPRLVSVPGPAMIIVEAGAISTRLDNRVTLLAETVAVKRFDELDRSGVHLVKPGQIVVTDAWDTVLRSNGSERVVLIVATLVPARQQYADHGEASSPGLFELAVTAEAPTALDEGVQVHPEEIIATPDDGEVRVRSGSVVLTPGSTVQIAGRPSSIVVIPYDEYANLQAVPVDHGLKVLNEAPHRNQAWVVLIETLPNET